MGSVLTIDIVSFGLIELASNGPTRLTQTHSVIKSLPLSDFSRLLRGRSCGESKLAFPDKHQVTDVNQRIGEIGQDPNRIPFENEVETHDHAAADAPIPERHRDHAFTLPLRREPLNEKSHRENSVPDKAEDDEITPVQTKEAIFLSDPVDSDDCEYV